MNYGFKSISVIYFDGQYGKSQRFVRIVMRFNKPNIRVTASVFKNSLFVNFMIIYDKTAVVAIGYRIETTAPKYREAGIFFFVFFTLEKIDYFFFGIIAGSSTVGFAEPAEEVPPTVMANEEKEREIAVKTAMIKERILFVFMWFPP